VRGVLRTAPNPHPVLPMTVGRRLPVLLLALLAAGAATACGGDPRPSEHASLVPGGDPQAGRAALRSYGCTSCHTVPGVRGARALVGPPLTRWSQRRYVAGRAVNDPETLMRFIRDPQAVSPGTAMPELGVTAEDARHIAAYLYTLR
jgi:cytochrome c